MPLEFSDALRITINSRLVAVLGDLFAGGLRVNTPISTPFLGVMCRLLKRLALSHQMVPI